MERILESVFSRAFFILALSGIATFSEAAPLIPLDPEPTLFDDSEVHGSEPGLAIVRGTVGGQGESLGGSGFTVSSPSFGRYIVHFNTPFKSQPTVTMAIHGFFTGQPQQFVQTIAIDDPAGGITNSGFNVYIAQPSNSVGSMGSFGSQNWDFIAIGPR